MLCNWSQPVISCAREAPPHQLNANAYNSYDTLCYEHFPTSCLI